MTNRLGLLFTLLRKRHDPAQILVRLALRKALAGCETVLDVGCGARCYTLRDLGVGHLTGVEAYHPAFLEAERLKTHDQLVLGDARELDRWFPPGAFDACVAMDVIEHLRKEDGLKLMRQMERVSRRRVIFFTPSGFLPQGHRVPGDLQAHLSGWEPREMAAYGYRVGGFLGPKRFRGQHHLLRKPALPWGVLSLLAHFLWSRHHPESAAAILCVKHLEGAPQRVPHPPREEAARRTRAPGAEVARP